MYYLKSMQEMKQRIIALAALFVLLLGHHAAAQNSHKARRILEDMNYRYRVTGIDATLFVEQIDGFGSLGSDKEGQLYLKGGSYRLELDGQVVISNGETLWTYVEDTNEVNVTDADDDVMNPWRVITAHRRARSFDLVAEAEKFREPIYIIDLELYGFGRDPEKLRYFIGQRDNNLMGWQVHTRRGQVFEYTLANSFETPFLDASKFTFNAEDYEDVKIVELR